MCNLVQLPPPPSHPHPNRPLFHPATPASTCRPSQSKEESLLSRTENKCSTKMFPSVLRQPPLHSHPAQRNYGMSKMSSHTEYCVVQPLDLTADRASTRAGVLGG